MSTSLAFLLAAVVLSVVGCALFLLRQRKPTSIDHGIESFQRELRALAPDASPAIAVRPTRPPVEGGAASAPSGPTGSPAGAPGADAPAPGDEQGR